jgi:hypothetical protein
MFILRRFRHNMCPSSKAAEGPFGAESQCGSDYGSPTEQRDGLPRGNPPPPAGMVEEMAKFRNEFAAAVLHEENELGQCSAFFSTPCSARFTLGDPHALL